MDLNTEINQAADIIRDALEEEGLVDHIVGAVCYAAIGAYLMLVGAGAYGIATYVAQHVFGM